MPLFRGTSGADSLAGGGEDDVLVGLGGADTLVGGEGADNLDGGVGADVIDGQAGDDTIESSGAATDAGDSIDGGEGSDEFSYFGTNNLAVDLTEGTTSSGATLRNVENVFGGEGDDSIFGGSDQNRLRGYVGDDTLDGAGDADLLAGEEGLDSLAGGAGDDTLEGGADDDTLDGGGGEDVAVFSGQRDEYVVTVQYDESTGLAARVTVADTEEGRDGTDTVVLDAAGKPTVERMLFADGGLVDVICFMPGTLVATPSGEVPVETLRRGDMVLTAQGRAAPVVWMGRQTVALRFADPVRVLPVRIEAGALGEGLPRRDLLVSPDHALFLDGVLVHAGALVNGTTVRRETDVPGRWTYWHVELADHALVLVEGVPAETFVDNAGRRAFDNWGEHRALYPGGRGIAEMPLPRAKSHRQVPRALRERIAAAAEKDAPPLPSAAA